MPGTDELDNELDTGVDDADENEGADADGDTPADASADATKGDKSEKRIRDLQSKADAETARANKAEAALKSLSAGKGDGAGTDPATAALMQELREASLDAIYGENPVLKQYGIDRSLIEGSTRTQMRESATSIVGLIKSVSTKVRNETLAEHGISAPASGAARKPPVDYGSMNDEDFKKLLDSM